MRTLSIRQPWAWLIINGLKDIENRTWETRYLGKMLVHASKGMTKAEYEDCLDTCHQVSRIKPFPDGTVLPPIDKLERGGIVGMTEIIGCVHDSESPWFSGPIGLQLGKSRVLPFMPFKGRLGFFDVDYDRSLLAA